MAPGLGWNLCHSRANAGCLTCYATGGTPRIKYSKKKLKLRCLPPKISKVKEIINPWANITCFFFYYNRLISCSYWYTLIIQGDCKAFHLDCYRLNKWGNYQLNSWIPTHLYWKRQYSCSVWLFTKRSLALIDTV